MYKRSVLTDMSKNERLVEATFRGGEPEEERHEDEVARARFDNAIAEKPRPSLIERILRLARRRS